MTKGFVFTLDALIALTLAIAIGATAMTALQNYSSTPFAFRHLSAAANDFLSVMEQSGVFNSYVGKSQDFVNGDLRTRLELLPSNYCGDVTLSVYRYSNGFVLDETYGAVTLGCDTPDQQVNAKRIFLNTDRERYGLAEITVWVR